jgi:hypothetical protein
MAAILGAPLSFFGCDDSSDSSGGDDPKSIAELESAMVKGVEVTVTPPAADAISFAEEGDGTGGTDEPPPNPPANDSGTFDKPMVLSVPINGNHAANTGLKTGFVAKDDGTPKAVFGGSADATAFEEAARSSSG